jgi:predicted transcriptional regulator
MGRVLKWLKRHRRTLLDMTVEEFAKEIRKNITTNNVFIEWRLK